MDSLQLFQLAEQKRLLHKLDNNPPANAPLANIAAFAVAFLKIETMPLLPLVTDASEARNLLSVNIERQTAQNYPRWASSKTTASFCC